VADDNMFVGRKNTAVEKGVAFVLPQKRIEIGKMMT
jgi:hypothetical protein